MAAKARARHRVALCLPVFQKEDGIARLIGKVPRTVNKIYVVIDEPDKSILSDLKKIGRREKRLELITNPVRSGVGNALRQAIGRAMENGCDIFVVMAANGKDDPAQIPRLVRPITGGGCDYVQGSRSIDGGVSENLPLVRKIIIKSLPLLWSVFNGVKYTEITNGFRAYRLDIFKDRKINIWQSWLDKYQMEYYIHYKATTGPYTFAEVPVSKIYRSDNPARHTKIRLKDGWQILSPLFYLKLGIRK